LTSYGIYEVLSDAVLDLVEDAVLPHVLYEELIFSIYFRTIEVLLAPIAKEERLRQAFRVEKAESREVPVPFNARLVETGNIVAWVSMLYRILCARLQKQSSPVHYRMSFLDPIRWTRSIGGWKSASSPTLPATSFTIYPYIRRCIADLHLMRWLCILRREGLCLEVERLKKP
jgi:hypothetical protein